METAVCVRKGMPFVLQQVTVDGNAKQALDKLVQFGSDTRCVFSGTTELFVFGDSTLAFTARILVVRQ
jgi:hypothetical protein